MAVLTEILTILDHWPTWKRVTAAPDQIQTLQNRVAELEKRLAKCPGEACPRCGELSYRVVSSSPHTAMCEIGAVKRKMKCEKCNFAEETVFVPE